MRLASSKAVRWAAAAVLLVLSLSLYLALTASTGLPGQSFRTVTAAFDNVGGLRVGDDVRVASVRVGQVRSIEYVDGKAEIELQMDPELTVYRDARALVMSRSALGQNFVMLEPGGASAGELAEGDALRPTAVTSPVNLDQLLSVFDGRTRRATASLIYEAGTGAAGHSSDLADLLTSAPELLDDLRVVARSLAAPETDLAGLIEASDRLAGRFDGRENEIRRLIGDLGDTTTSLGVDDGAPLAQTIDHAAPALSATTVAMRDLRTPLRQLDRGLRTLTPGARALGVSTPTLRAGLREGVPVLDRVPDLAGDASPALGSLADSMDDARPLADRLTKTFASASVPLSVLAPYAPEMVTFFERWNSANQYGDASGHSLRITLLARPESVTGVLPQPDPFVHRNAYPAPGQARHDRAQTIFGSR